MTNPLTPLTDTLDFAFLTDRVLATLIRGLLQNDFTLVARPLVRMIRKRRGDDPVGGESLPAKRPEPPIGPFRLAEPGQACDLLIYVPRSLESYLIDDITGHYGYSHVAVDCGEVDVANGRRVMVEATPHVGVHRSYLDKYGPREFIRIPLAPVGVDGGSFRRCILEKLGEPYDMKEALTWGMVDDPAQQVCSDLAADCLPASLREAITRAARAGRLGWDMVSIHGPARIPAHIFVSPNGFARFFGAPQGHHIDEPDTTIMPRIRRGGGRVPRLALGLAVALGAVAAVWLVRRLQQQRRLDS